MQAPQCAQARPFKVDPCARCMGQSASRGTVFELYTKGARQTGYRDLHPIINNKYAGLEHYSITRQLVLAERKRERVILAVLVHPPTRKHWKCLKAHASFVSSLELLHTGPGCLAAACFPATSQK
ncbi:hypothetical protein NDU88_005492 [Pleurodeles waltl]|uniref:Uncharacterized protein n=1 Tax=Pleurodeles waltl TaxID=8319 RepID=A0AAV7LLG2_PLEWA|nr:hypothetical protein NDU88_005492 [Pleurodeles waltl]